MKKVILPELLTSDEFDVLWKTADQLAPLIKEICESHGFEAKSQKHIKYATNIVFEIDESYFFKLYSPLSEHEYLRESAALSFLKGNIKIPIPTVLAEGAVQGWRYLILSKVQGVQLCNVWNELSTSELCELNEELGHTIATIHSLPPPTAPSFQVDWPAFLEQQARICADYHRKYGFDEQWASQIDTYVKNNINFLHSQKRQVLICSDYHHGNVLVEKKNGRWKISGIVDFADSMIGDPEYDFVSPGLYIARSRPELLKAFFNGYGITRMDDALSKRCFTYTLLHRFAALDYCFKTFVKIPSDTFELAQLGALMWPVES